jgi:nucleolar GTP-binding protein
MDLVEDQEHVNKYIEQVENPLMLSASKGTGVPEIIAKMEEFDNESKKSS